MKNKTLHFITEVGVFSALGLLFDFLAGLYSEPIFPQGGSISIAMIPIFIMAFRWGLKGGLTTGLIIAITQLPYSSVFRYGLSWETLLFIILLDYILAYTLLGLAGLYTKRIRNSKEMSGKLYYITNGILLAGLLRTICHVISGLIFFRQFIPEFIVEQHIWYYWSIIYNLGYMVPSIILCILITRALIKRFHTNLLNPDSPIVG